MDALARGRLWCSRIHEAVPRLAVLASLCIALAGAAEAADLPAPTSPPLATPAPAGWRFQATLYGWATGLNGDVGVRNLPATNIDVPFSKILANLDGALMGSFYGTNGQWMFIADVVYAKLSNSESFGPQNGGSLTTDLIQTIATGAIGYLLPTGRPDLDFALTVGLRYMQLKGEMALGFDGRPATLSASQTQSWIDPTIGMSAHWTINERWFLNAIVDIGGFDVGSKLSSTGYLGVGYMWTKSLSTAIGYRYLYEDYEGPGATTGQFRYDVLTHGPTVSVAWHF